MYGRLSSLINQLSAVRKIPLILCGEVRKLTRVKVELVRVAIRIHMVRDDVHRCHLMLLLPLHAPVLEPDLYLSLCQAERMCNLNPSSPRQVPIEVELFLQFKCLISSVRCSLALGLSVRVHCT